MQLYNFLVQSRKNPNLGKPRNGNSARLDSHPKVLVFQGIGPLTTLLICGDCLLAGLVPMSSAQQMGALVGMVAKGALTGLNCLGLTNGSSSQKDIENAFVELHNYLDRSLQWWKRMRWGMTM